MRSTKAGVGQIPRPKNSTPVLNVTNDTNNAPTRDSHSSTRLSIPKGDSYRVRGSGLLDGINHEPNSCGARGKLEKALPSEG